MRLTAPPLVLLTLIGLVGATGCHSNPDPMAPGSVQGDPLDPAHYPKIAALEGLSPYLVMARQPGGRALSHLEHVPSPNQPLHADGGEPEPAAVLARSVRAAPRAAHCRPGPAAARARGPTPTSTCVVPPRAP